MPIDLDDEVILVTDELNGLLRKLFDAQKGHGSIITMVASLRLALAAAIANGYALEEFQGLMVEQWNQVIHHRSDYILS